MVTAQQQQPDHRLFHASGLIHGVSRQHQRLDCALQRHGQQLSDSSTCALVRRGCLDEKLCRRRPRSDGRQCLGLFHVGGVIAARAIDDCILTGSSNHLEFFTQITANGAAVGRHGAIGQTESVKNSPVGIGHHLIAGLGTGLVTVETVGVLHDELTPSHQTKAGPSFVAKLGLNLIEILWQLFVTLDFLPRDVGHHLLAGRLNHKIAIMAILDTQQLRSVRLKTPRLLPQFGWLHHRHAQFHGTGTIHLLAHDRLDLANHTQPHGHQGVNASAKLLDHAGTRHQLVTDHFGVSRCFLEGGYEELRSFHGRTLKKLGARPLDARRLLCIMEAV